MSGATAIVNARLALDDGLRPGGLLLRDGAIASLLAAAAPPPEGAAIVDARGGIVAPGLIDVHVHGGGGFDLMAGDAEQVRKYARWVLSRGITGLLVSTSGRDHPDILRKLRAQAPCVGPVEGGARVLGFHLEGPYINPVRKGAFPPKWLRAPSVTEYGELFEASGGAVRQVTLAPELSGANALMDAVLASGAVVAIGHTDASYEQAAAAIERGATHVTHCFNAMRPFGHRDPGVLAAVLTSDAVTAELIGDGAHVDYAAARVLLRARGARGVVLITDGMPLAGTPDGEATWEGQAIRVEGGKAVRVGDGTIVGGVITLDQAVRNAVARMGVARHEALAMASANPARAMRLEGLGALAPGCAADLVLLDDGLHVVETWVAGERVWKK